MLRITLLSLLMLAPLAALAAEPPREARVNASLALDLDADGRIVALAPIGKTAEGLKDFLLREVAAWTFEPGRIDGRGVPTRTTLVVTLAASKAGDDALALRIVDATTGPAVAKGAPPSYPRESIRARESGEVLLRVDVDPAGRATTVAVEHSNASRRLRNAAIAAAREWTFEPERVGGHPIAATIVLPIRFCLTGYPCPRLPVEQGVGEGDHPRLVGAPTVRILARNSTGAG
jgi:TonB family protein